MFRDYSLVSNVDKKFTEYVNLLKNALKDDFIKYDSGYGYQTDEFQEFMCDLPSDLYEDEKEELYIIWSTKIESVKSICSFLENWDMIVLSKTGKPIISRSNHPNVAKYILEMFNLCK